MKAGDQLEVTIEKMTLRGGGLARHEGRVIFVDLSAPGDRLKIEVTEVKKNHAFARILQVLEPSEHRRAAPCPAYGRCGGCNWQHLPESFQQEQKQKLVTEAIRKVWPEEFLIQSLVTSPCHFRYRNRIQLKKIVQDVGYFERGSHDLVSIEDCLLAEEPLIPLIQDLREQAPTPQQNWELSLTTEMTGQIRPVTDRDVAFSQVNRFVNELLQQELLRAASGFDWKNIWDLYCGSGNLTFPIAQAHEDAHVVGVEMSADAITKARARAGADRRYEFFASSVDHFLRRRAPPRESLVILDPPRAGVHESVARSLALSAARRILYVSCDPMTLARDLGVLRQAAPGRWRITQLRCFDMFPQTDHVETLVQLDIDTPETSVNL